MRLFGVNPLGSSESVLSVLFWLAVGLAVGNRSEDRAKNEDEDKSADKADA